MHDRPVLIGVLLEDACLTLGQLCSACAVSADWVIGQVREGHLHALGDGPSQWRFSSRELWRARQIRRLEMAFDAAPELAALVTDLMEELDRLRAQLQRLPHRRPLSRSVGQGGDQ
jgi:chaperone modulatory protein CbpM